MKDNNWRENLDLLIDKNLNELIKETKIYNDSIKSAKDKSKAQMWVALAILNHKINYLYSRCNNETPVCDKKVESTHKKIDDKNNISDNKKNTNNNSDNKTNNFGKISKEELKSILDTLETL